MITAQFVTIIGAPIDVPDPTIEVFGAAGVVIHGPVAMIQVMTGFYYYDYD